MSFREIVGHERIKQLLIETIAAGRLPPALLLSGPEGVGKKRLALEAARALLCQAGGGDACETCASCQRSGRGLHPDLIVVEPETRVIKVEQVRELVAEIQARPFEARARAFVLDEAHSLSEQASNALLKSLEEPPRSSHVMLVTAAPQALLPTIRSRCQRLRLGPLPRSELQQYLIGTAQLGAEEARLRAMLSAGSLGRALAFESEAYRSLRGELLELLGAAPQMDPLQRLEAAERLREQTDLPLALVTLRSLCRDLAALRSGVPAERAMNADVAETLLGLSAGPLGDAAQRLAGAVGEALAALRRNANKLLTLDVLMDAFPGAGPDLQH
jgi:DNA polymerase-3 subunit delta'